MRLRALAATFVLLSLRCHAPRPVAPPGEARTASAAPATDALVGTASIAEPLSDPPAARLKPEPKPPAIELPRGGREIFPAHRIVGFCGTPGAPALGRLTGDLPKRVKSLTEYAEKYAFGRKVLPVLELIAVVVLGAPGSDGKWRRRVPDSVVEEYLKAARSAKALLLLNIQPGHSDFLTEAKHFERWLGEPEVGLALDPEWAMKGKQKPGTIFGQTSGAAINDVAAYVAGIIKARDLPEKVIVFHQVNTYVVKDESTLAAQDGIVFVKSIDGLGPKGAKVKTYNHLMKDVTPVVHPGFKLFFDEDTQSGGTLMTPAEVMALTPQPEYVMYE